MTHHRRQQQAIVCRLVLPWKQLVAIVQALHQHAVMCDGGAASKM